MVQKASLQQSCRSAFRIRSSNTERYQSAVDSPVDYLEGVGKESWIYEKNGGI